ncbi:MAG: hypothetical protein KF851_10370 [Pirellulaceae bacterium]|nr:hypothetical protein [Pirellulaceae bacterium]
MKNLSLLIVFGFVSAVLAPSLSQAQVRFVNLSSSDAYIAQAKYTDGYGSSRPGNTSSLGWYVGDHWTYSGWYAVKPGTSIDLPQGFYYVELNGERINFNNRQSVAGLVKNPGFSVKVDYNNSFQKNLELEQKNGYRQASFLEFHAGIYTISVGSPAYELVSETFNFHLPASKSRQTQTFQTRQPIAWIDLQPNTRSEVSNFRSQINGQQFSLSADVAVGYYTGGEDGRYTNDGTFWGKVTAYSLIKLPPRHVKVVDTPIPKPPK